VRPREAAAPARAGYRERVTATATARRLRRVPPPVVDIGLAVAVAVMVTIGVSGNPEPEGKPGDLLAYGLGLALAVALLVRRRWPLGVLAASFVLLGAYHALNYPPLGYGLSLAVPLFTVTMSGHLRIAVVTIAVVLLGMVTARYGLEGEAALQVFEDTVREGAGLLALVFLAEAVRARRALAAEVEQRLRRGALDRERDAEARVVEERLRIARELHDVVAHTVAVVTVQAGVAADVLDDDPAAARAALRTLRRASREALTELSATVGLLRAAEPGPSAAHPPAPGAEPGRLAARPPAPGLRQLDALLASARDSGTAVTLDVQGQPRALPAAVDLTVYRVVQEAITNVIRHAGAASTTVTVRYRPDDLLVDVVDDGRCGGSAGSGGLPGDAGSAGNGLLGMAERVTALGGQLSAGPRPEGGFAVRARLPAGRIPA